MAFAKKGMMPGEEPTEPEPSKEMPARTGKECGCAYCTMGRGGNFGKKILLTLLGVLFVYLTLYVGTLMRNNMKKYQYIGMADQMERTVTVNGYGKVTGNNDIAVTTIGYSNVDKDVAKAQGDNKKIMDQVMVELKKMDIEDKDLQTNYTIYPEYNYTQDKGSELRGYRVSNSVMVKIRDLNKIPSVLALAGKFGATEVNGLSFTIDDPQNLKTQARDKALEDAEMKATKLAQQLGVRLIAVVSYNEYEGGQYEYSAYAADKVGGEFGGGAPAVSSGSKDVVMNVNLTYKIAPR